MRTQLPESLTSQLERADPSLVFLLDHMRWGENPWDEQRILQLLDHFTASPYWELMGAPENPGNDTPVTLTHEQIENQRAALMASRLADPAESSEVFNLAPEELDRLFDDDLNEPPA